MNSFLRKGEFISECKKYRVLERKRPTLDFIDVTCRLEGTVMYLLTYSLAEEGVRKRVGVRDVYTHLLTC